MLSALRIANFALIERAELLLAPGLNVLTGETGAGKSILLDALSCVLGGRASDRVIRHGCDAAEMEAQFDAVQHPEVLAQLDALGIALEDGRLIARRVIHRTATKSRAWICGRLVSVAQLRAIVGPLVDLQAQHAQHRLLEPAAHLQLLDRYAGVQAEAATYRAAYARYKATARALAELDAAIAARADRLDYLRFVHKELADLQLREGEQAALQDKLHKARSAEAVAKTVADAAAALAHDGGVRDVAARLGRALGKHVQYDERVPQLVERLAELESQAAELSWDLETFLRSMDRDESALHKAAERLDALTRALKKYGGSEQAALQRLAEVSAELDADATELQRHDLHKQLQAQATALRTLAEQLLAKRQAAAGPFAAAVTALVQQLGMPKALLTLAHSVSADEPGPDGLDAVQLVLQANAGEAGGPLGQVASGGELSRILLAVQRVAGTQDGGEAEVPTAIYDEADAGLSGSTGLVLGRFLAEAGRDQQILAISHLPQVAAAADQHIRVWKEEHDGRTRSHLQVLDEPERETELARMLGKDGEHAATALAHAAQLRLLQRVG